MSSEARPQPESLVVTASGPTALRRARTAWPKLAAGSFTEALLPLLRSIFAFCLFHPVYSLPLILRPF
ncbi:hypothetical protein VTN00DRAFT_214 [Thermoascus crustaceus]|uniref:uncharacterized protein n=1 Tax=Thermoascus crustaceus TaxID=5088 RepID=UPI0037423176